MLLCVLWCLGIFAARCKSLSRLAYVFWLAGLYGCRGRCRDGTVSQTGAVRAGPKLAGGVMTLPETHDVTLMTSSGPLR